MHHITRRLSPSLIVAIAALFAALAGTAVAAEIITSSDQIKNGVITGSDVASRTLSSGNVKDRSLTRSRLTDPQLNVRVLTTAGVTTVLPESDGKATRVDTGRYNVTFGTGLLNPGGGTRTILSEGCAFTATPRDKPAWITVVGPVAGLPNTVRVDAVFPDPANPEVLVGVDRSFDIIASC